MGLAYLLLQRSISKQSDVTKLQKLYDTGLDEIIINPLFGELSQSEADELKTVITTRITQLS